MSFKGIVTRKDQDAGVTLEAKIVTPNKVKATKQRFKVRVKKSGLSDYECCVLDQETVRKKLSSQQNLTSLTSDVSLTYNGDNGTKITYEIEDTGTTLLSNYFSADGKILGRPLYGEDSASGYLVMTVSKGSESLKTRLRVIVEGVSASEVLNCSAITEASLWNSIKGQNDLYNATNLDSSGHKNIFYSLKFIENTNSLYNSTDRATITSLSKTPVTITWSIEDNARNSVITEDRIKEDGSIFTPAYKDACTLTNNATLVGNTTGQLALYNRIRISGLKLTATLKLGDNTRVITLDCSTCSKYITNEEVIGYAQSLADILTVDNIDNGYKYREKTDSTIQTITIPSEYDNDTYYIGLPYSETAAQSYAISDLNLELGGVIYTFSHRILDTSYELYTDSTDIFLNGVTYNEMSAADSTHFGGSYRKIVAIDVAKLKASTVSTDIIVETTVTAQKYSKDGIDPNGGTGLSTTLYCRIKFDTSKLSKTEEVVA